MARTEVDYKNWQEKYPGMPRIPEPKIWLENQESFQATEEQRIGLRLIQGEQLTGFEINSLVECIQFYHDLNEALRDFDFSVLNNEKELELFIGYIDYAYNYTVLISNEVEVETTYRLVRNIGGISKSNVKEISYPPLEIVTPKGLYNRASSPKSTMFYSCENLDSCFLELKPNKGEIVTLGFWRPIDNPRVLCYPIPSNSKMQDKNEHAHVSRRAFERIQKKSHPILGKHLSAYFDILSFEYSKEVNNRIEYLISALFSEHIMKPREDQFNFSGIIYPSIGAKYSSSNLALAPEIVNARFRPYRIFELEILNTKYENYTPKSSSLSVVDTKVRRKANGIDEKGNILWN